MSERKRIDAILLGIVGAFFFAFTFILNRSMSLGGGYWMYSAILRYVFTLPILFAALIKGKKYAPVLTDINGNAPHKPCEGREGIGAGGSELYCFRS